MTAQCVLVTAGEAGEGRTGGHIPAGVPHVVANLSDSEPAVAVLARTDANEQEDVTDLPALDALPHVHFVPEGEA
jgi:uncharacterized RmlC-like cupin family protein